MLALLVSAAALAASPVPDRSTVSSSPTLVGARSLEVEAGASWSGDFQAPLRLKYGAGWLEPRLGLDPLGFGAGASLDGGVKIRLLEEDAFHLSGALRSVVPLQAGVPWIGAAGLLAMFPLERGQLLVNASVELTAPDGVVSLGGVPISVAYAFPVAKSLGAFIEGASVFDRGLRDTMLDGGLRVDLTDSLLLDAGVGWSLSTGRPMAQLGVTANLGRIGG